MQVHVRMQHGTISDIMDSINELVVLTFLLIY